MSRREGKETAAARHKQYIALMGTFGKPGALPDHSMTTHAKVTVGGIEQAVSALLSRFGDCLRQ
ncbi:MAG: hypothetical protein WEE89_15155 [Gemmatimonadota bacterium]